MKTCSVVKNLRIERGGIEDYKRLARYHYRGGSPGTWTAIFVIKHYGGASPALHTKQTPTASLREARRRGSCGEPVGVIVYTLPSEGAELRNVATNNMFSNLDKKSRFTLINKNIRCIRRVVIEPRFRGLGLASQLVRETLPKVNTPIVEAMAVMGLVNPFFEKAGMKPYKAGMPERCVRLVEALSLVGIEEDELIDAEEVQGKLDKLEQREAWFIEVEIRRFLESYGKRKYDEPGLERTRFLLSKLTARPVYYVWFNANLELRI